MCFGCSKEPSHGDGSFEYPQHMIWLRNKKNNFQLYTLIWGPVSSVLIYMMYDNCSEILNTFTFCSQIKFLFSGLEFTKCLYYYRENPDRTV